MTIRNSTTEIHFIFAYYNHLNPEQLTKQHYLSRVSGSTPISTTSKKNMAKEGTNVG